MTARHVLVVDDEVGIRELLRDILEDEGYHVQLAENAANAIGANPLVARVSALFHDVGKTENPRYFAENQRDPGGVLALRAGEADDAGRAGPQAQMTIATAIVPAVA